MSASTRVEMQKTYAGKMSLPYLISPSILSSDFARLGEQISEVEEAGADRIHVDVMDGQFVPNLTMGPFIVETCRRITKLPLDAHLMVITPERLLHNFIQAGADLLYVHVETSPHLYRTLETIREMGIKVGVVINPGTPASFLEEVLHLVDEVLVMTVNPGYSGQKFIPEVIPKISKIRQMLDRFNPAAYIAVDGGITEETLPQVCAAGANVIIASTAVFKHQQGTASGIKVLRNLFPA